MYVYIYLKFIEPQFLCELISVVNPEMRLRQEHWNDKVEPGISTICKY